MSTRGLNGEELEGPFVPVDRRAGAIERATVNLDGPFVLGAEASPSNEAALESAGEVPPAATPARTRSAEASRARFGRWSDADDRRAGRNPREQPGASAATANYVFEYPLPGNEHRRIFLLYDFKIDGASLRADHRQFLQELAKWMRADPTRKWQIFAEAHASRTGAASHDDVLSQDRYLATRAFLELQLLGAGFDAASLRINGEGVGFRNSPLPGEDPTARSVYVVVQPDPSPSPPPAWPPSVTPVKYPPRRGGGAQPKLVYKIHPAIGIARVGDSPNGWFVGPETPGRSAKPGTYRDRDSQGRIKRQAARFRIWEYEEDQNGKQTPKREITLQQAKIDWTVNLANKKAAFFQFKYLAGEHKAGTAGGPLDGYANDHPLRNANVAPGAKWDAELRKQQLFIDPGPVTITAAEGATKAITSSNSNIPIPSLGALETDRLGRLYVKGGSGVATAKNSAALNANTFNNDGWFDDISDGPVSATLAFPDGRKVHVGGWTEAALKARPQTPSADGGGAWVLVTPPDFAPQIDNVVTLYDLLTDVARQHLPIPNNTLYDKPKSGTGSAGQVWRLSEQKKGLSTYVPSFTYDIYPILRRALEVRWLDSTLFAMIGVTVFHGADPKAIWLRFSKKSDTLRRGIFGMIRPPPPAVETPMQRMPNMWGDGYKNNRLLALTATQYAVLKQWNDGNFIEDWPGQPPVEPAENIAPDGLDRAALEGTVGGALGPGIEASWLIRDPQNFAEPYRIKHHSSIPPGHFSAQMALPWQSDFVACHKTPDGVSWWPAVRPDDALPAGASTMLPWARTTATGTTLLTRQDFVNFGWRQLGFVVDVSTNGDRSRFEERERK
jgi:outer membrane protein OmpA-like peptidoglycan-associated protein